MTDPEADTRGVEPITDELLDGLRTSIRPWLEPRTAQMQGSVTYGGVERLIARVDAEVAKRREAERERDALVAEFAAERDDAIKARREAERELSLKGDAMHRVAIHRIDAEAEVQRLTRERDRQKDIAESWELMAGSHLDYVNKYYAEVQRLREALERIRDELGVPSPEYPAPVANAADIAAAALDREGEE